ncbi:MAG: UDP-N-acetylmuramoyl-L-alanyl-D-glutamate--2,6-diaminopimelate ligase [Microthrixaceae bacterium]
MVEVEVARLAGAIGGSVVGPDGSGSIHVTHITHDSRSVVAGSLFCCVVGERSDGHDFATDAVAAGATALLVERRLDLDVAQIVVADSRGAMGPAAALLFGDPTRHGLEVIGVTGTNGKTTVSRLIAELSTDLGVPCGVVGTLTGPRTTPEAPELWAALRGFLDAGSRRAAIEVSSHALDRHRVEGIRFAVAVFTNLGVDHLDYHGTREQYFAAKARLFHPSFTDLVVLNRDDVHGRLLLDVSHRAGLSVVPYGLDDAEDLVMDMSGSRFRWRGRRVAVPLVGRFNVSNALAAAETLVALGHGVDDVAAAMEGLTPPPGRFERIDVGGGVSAIVDYAHTPEALENVLATVREVNEGGRVITVFGCGGDRDHGKRPLMGRAAADASDVVIVTTDNARGEDPSSIAAQVLAGTRIAGRESDARVQVVLDRRDAIAAALATAAPGDVVVVAGKGHETTQIIGDAAVHFDDREVVRSLAVDAPVRQSLGEVPS